MKILIVTLLTGLFHYTNASDTLKLNQALKLRNIQITARANGGLGEDTLKLIIKNNLRRPLLIELDPGTQFRSENPEVQDLIIFEDEVIALAPREQKELNVYAACTQLSNLGPGAEDMYQMGSVAESVLAEVAAIVARNDFKNSTAQAAVWAITDNNPTQGLHNGDNVDVTWELATLIARHKSLQLPEKEQFFANPLPFRRIVYSARKDLVYHAPEPFKGTLAIYKNDGELVREYFNNKFYENGLHFYSIGINNIVEENTQYIARLTDENDEVLAEHTLDPSEAYVPAKEEILSVNFEYAVRKKGVYDLVVFDDKENLVEYIYKDRPLTPGYRSAKFNFIYAQREVEFFVFKVIDSEGNFTHEQKILTKR